MRSANSNHRCCQCRSRPGMGVLAVSPPASGGEVGRRGPVVPGRAQAGQGGPAPVRGPARAGRLATWALARAAVHALSPARLQSGRVRSQESTGLGTGSGWVGAAPAGSTGGLRPHAP